MLCCASWRTWRAVSLATRCSGGGLAGGVCEIGLGGAVCAMARLAAVLRRSPMAHVVVMVAAFGCGWRTTPGRFLPGSSRSLRRTSRTRDARGLGRAGLVEGGGVGVGGAASVARLRSPEGRRERSRVGSGVRRRRVCEWCRCGERLLAIWRDRTDACHKPAGRQEGVHNPLS